jgi:hypothetical protein
VQQNIQKIYLNKLKIVENTPQKYEKSKIKCLWLRLRGTSEFKGSRTDVPAEHPLFLLNAACLAEKQQIPIL